MDGLPAKEDRYDHGDEVLEACCALWDCWQDDAMIMDKASGLFIDPTKVRYANYEGRAGAHARAAVDSAHAAAGTARC